MRTEWHCSFDICAHVYTYVCIWRMCLLYVYQLNNRIKVLSSESVEFSLPDRYPPSVHSSEICGLVPGFSCTEYKSVRNLGGEYLS